LSSKTCLQFLSVFPKVASLKNATVEDIAATLIIPRKASSWRYDKAQKILDLARESLAESYVSDSIHVVIIELVGTMIHFTNALDSLRNQMIQLAKTSPQYELLQTIPGVGEVTAAFMIADIGSIERFKSKKALVAFAGLDSSIYQSGQFYNSGKISKRGSPHLRTALYRSAVAAITIRNNRATNPTLRLFYDKKVAEGKPKKVALIACANKMTRIIYGVLVSGQPFHA